MNSKNSYKTEEEVLEYLKWCRENNVTAPIFYGYFPFTILVKNGLIYPDYSSVRRMYSGIIDTVYFITEDFLLYNMGIKDSPKLDPKEILWEEDEFQGGWEPGQLNWENIDKLIV